MNSHENELDAPAPPSKGSFLTLPVVFLIGWIIYEVTHQPAFAAMAMCLKFGWENFRTARWLWRTDPYRNRGKACYWLYIAAGLWETAVIGVAMVLLTVVLTGMIQAQQQGQAPNVDILSLLQGASLTILFGFVFSTAFTYVALVYAARHAIRPWLSRSVHIARRHNHWPPLYGHRNSAFVLVVTTIIVTFTFVIPACLLLGSAILKDFAPQLLPVAVIVPLLCYFVVLPATIFFFLNLRRRGFFAQHPADCWGDEELPEPQKSPDEQIE